MGSVTRGAFLKSAGAGAAEVASGGWQAEAGTAARPKTGGRSHPSLFWPRSESAPHFDLHLVLHQLCSCLG